MHRRTKREVHYILSETVVTEIEARDEAEHHGKRTASLVMSEAKRIAELFVEALRSANARIGEAAADAQVRLSAAVKCSEPPEGGERRGGCDPRNDESHDDLTDTN